MKGLALTAALCLAVVAIVAAAEVWETTPFTEWSDKDAQKVLTNSPWAGEARITHTREGGGLGPVPDWEVVVTLRSALPVKQALVRQQIGRGGVPTPTHQAQLAAAEPFYLVAVAGLPPWFATQIQAIGKVTSIRRDGKPPIAPVAGSVLMVDRNGKPVTQVRPDAGQPRLVLASQRGGGGGFGGGGLGGEGFGGGREGRPSSNPGATATLIFGFPRDGAIVESDREFEFTTVVGGYNVKRTFKLKDMVFKGMLAL